MRCVVTGQTAGGKAVVARDEDVAPITLTLLPGFEFYRVWGSDSTQGLPSAGDEKLPPRYFPPMGGFRFGYFVIPPEAERVVAEIDMASALGEMQKKLPGLAEVLEFDHPGMHTSDTVDFDVVLSGEAYLELDDGAEVLLKAGDCVVQNGTRHAWHNRSKEKCVIAVTVVGAERRG